MLKSGFCYSFCYSFCYFCFTIKLYLKTPYFDKYNCHKIQIIVYELRCNIRISY
nr:MAG TPA: hypothetical protein [Caudoviricetes sp.]